MHDADPNRWWFMEELTAEALQVGASVEILRSDKSWSRAAVTAIQEDGTTVVQIDDTKTVKKVPTALLDKYIREPEAEFQGIADTVHNAFYTVGDAVEVLRSDGAWTYGVVKEIMDDGIHVVKIDTDSPKSIKKIISAKHVPKFIRSVPARNMETSPEFSVSVGYEGV